MCGVPAPTVWWKFNHNDLMIAPKTPVNKFTFNYSMQLPRLTQKMCGEELFLQATSEYQKTRLTRIWPVYLRRCKFFTSFVSIDI